MSDTPRADDIASMPFDSSLDRRIALTDFARQLERELNTALAACAVMREALEHYSRKILTHGTDIGEAARDALSTNAGAELLAEVKRYRGAKAEINGLELKLMTAWADVVQLKLDNEKLRRKVAAVEGMAEVCKEAANDSMVIAGDDDGGLGCQDETVLTPLARHALAALSAWQEANKI